MRQCAIVAPMGAKKPADPIIQSLTVRDLAARMVDVAGMTQQQADEAIQGLGLALGTWLESMALSLPQGCRADCILPGVGRLVVSYQPDRPPSKWRIKYGLPQRPGLLTITLAPLPAVRAALSRCNRAILSAYYTSYVPLAKATSARIRADWRSKQPTL